MSKHTPGPWELGREGKYRVRISAPNWDSFAKVVVALKDVDSTGGRNPSAEGNANARLIAAAPELLEALKALREAIRNVPIPVESFDQLPVEEADLAIRKAEAA